MNIFVTSSCPIICAKNLDDSRVVKMLLESTQMLCNALVVNDISGIDVHEYTKIKYNKNSKKYSKGRPGHSYSIMGKQIYAPSHSRHPCSVWVAKNNRNWMWLWKHAAALSDEYTLRFGKIHSSAGVLRLISPKGLELPTGGLTSFPNCAANQSVGVSYKHVKDVHDAYQQYLVQRWLTAKRQPRNNRISFDAKKILFDKSNNTLVFTID